MSECKCCTGVEVLTPAVVMNRSGLTSIVYRSGEHGSFFESMLASLSLEKDFGFRTRETDDLSVALLDAASVVLDIVTFYQERLANEHYLRTATERQSVVGLGQLTGYRLAPGRAAATQLAFTLESNVTPGGQFIGGVPAEIVIPIGTKVQSVPGPNEKPQIFETVEAIKARAEWNAIALRSRARHPDSAQNNNQVELAGSVNAVRDGDMALLTGRTGGHTVQRVRSVQPTQDQKSTFVYLSGQNTPGAILSNLDPEPVGAPPASFDSNYIGTHIRYKRWAQAELETLIEAQRWNADDFARAIRKSQASEASGLTLTVLGAPAALFGHNAREFPKSEPAVASAQMQMHIVGVPVSTQVEETVVVVAANTDKYANTDISDQSAGTLSFYLDNVYAAAVPGRRIVLSDPGVGTAAATIDSVSERSLLLFELTGRASQITVSGVVWLNQQPNQTFGDFRVRRTSVYIETTRMPALPPSIELVSGYQPVTGASILLDGPYLGIKAGRSVILSGELSSLPGQTASELATVAETRLEDGYTRLNLTAPLHNSYLYSTVRVLANVADATHGETVTETLGSGDAREAFQRFRLKQPRLTWVSAATAGGVRAELLVRVNGVEWRLVDNLYEAGPQNRVYILQSDAEGNTYVVFGDGRNGARLPSGPENVTATYRRGLGRDGLVKAGQLTMALSRPLGMKDVTNPSAATGGGDPETLETARLSLPFPLRTLGRIVSLQDYEDFARASAGVAKSSAHWIWNGQRWTVLVTIAGPGGEAIPEGTQAFDDLLKAMRDAGDPLIAVTLAQYRPKSFDVNAGLIVDKAYESDVVLSAAKGRLLDAFSFDRRAFAQPVILSEVISVLQGTEGVIALDLNALFLSGTTPDLTQPPQTVLVADGPTRSGSSLLGAQLITVDQTGLRDVTVQA